MLTAEGTYDHWSLFNRFIMANDILDAADAAGEPKEKCAADVCASNMQGNLDVELLLCSQQIAPGTSLSHLSYWQQKLRLPPRAALIGLCRLCS